MFVWLLRTLLLPLCAKELMVDMSRLKSRRIIAAGIAALILPFVSVLGLGYLSMTIGRDAHKTLNSYRLVLEVLAPRGSPPGESRRMPRAMTRLVRL